MNIDGDRNWTATCQVVQSRFETVTDEERGHQAVSQLAQFLDGRAQVGDGGLQVIVDRSASRSAKRGRAQANHDGDQALLSTVVEVPLNPMALRGRGDGQPCPGILASTSRLRSSARNRMLSSWATAICAHVLTRSPWLTSASCSISATCSARCIKKKVALPGSTPTRKGEPSATTNSSSDWSRGYPTRID